jgi:hypothetical protein
MALTSLVSLSSKSPRTIATTKRPSPVTMNTAFAVFEVGMPRNWASASIVVVSGVWTSSIGSSSSASGAATVEGAIWRFDA